MSTLNESPNRQQKWLKGLELNQAVLALGFARLADALGNSMLIITIPLYVIKIAQPGWSVPDIILIGILISTYRLVSALFQPLSGMLIDRIQHPKLFIQAGQILIGCSALVFMEIHQYEVLFFVRLIQGVGLALMLPASLALLAGHSREKERGGSIGLYSSLRQVGLGVGPIIGGWLIVKFGFNAVFLTAGILVLLSAGLVQMVVQDLPFVKRAAQTGTEKRFRYDPGVISLGFANFMMASSMMMITTLQGEFSERLQLSALGFGLAFSAFTFAKLLLQWPIGRLSDRINRKSVILWGLILLAPTTILLGQVTSTLQLAGLRSLQGISSGAINAPGLALVADLSSPVRRGRQMSVIPMGFGLGAALGPLIAGFLATIRFEIPFLIGGLLSVVGAWVVYRNVPDAIHQAPIQS